MSASIVCLGIEAREGRGSLCRDFLSLTFGESLRFYLIGFSALANVT